MFLLLCEIERFSSLGGFEQTIENTARRLPAIGLVKFRFGSFLRCPFRFTHRWRRWRSHLYFYFAFYFMFYCSSFELGWRDSLGLRPPPSCLFKLWIFFLQFIIIFFIFRDAKIRLLHHPPRPSRIDIRRRRHMLMLMLVQMSSWRQRLRL